MANTTGKGFGGRGWLMIILYVFSNFAMFGIMSSMNATGPFFAQTFGWDTRMLTSAYSIAQVFGLLSMIVVGQLCVNHSAYRIGLVLGAVAVVAIFVWAFVTAYWQYMLVLIIMIICLNGYGLVCIYNIAGNWMPRKAPLAAGIFTMGIPLGSGAGMVVIGAGVSGPDGSLLKAYMPFIIILALVLVLIGIFLRDRPEELGFYPDNAPPDANTKAALERAKQNVINNPWTNKRMLGTKETYLMSISIGILLFGSVGIMAQIAPIVMGKDPEFGAKYLNVVFPLISVIACIGSWLCGFIDQKFGSKKAIIMASIFMMVACVLMMLNNIILVLIGIACMCVFMGGGSNFATSGIATYWKRSGFARGYRIINSLANILQSIGPALITIVAVPVAGVLVHGQPVYDYTRSFVMCLILGAVSVAAMLGFNEKNLRQKEVEWVGHEIEE